MTKIRLYDADRFYDGAFYLVIPDANNPDVRIIICFTKDYGVVTASGVEDTKKHFEYWSKHLKDKPFIEIDANLLYKCFRTIHKQGIGQ